MNDAPNSAPAINNLIAWIEIPTRDIHRAKEFYGQVLKKDLTIDDNSGPNPLIMLTQANDMGVSGHLYPGTPAEPGSGSTIHFNCTDDLKAVMQRIENAGGTVVSEIITIPYGAFFYAQDPDGNSISMFKLAE